MELVQNLHSALMSKLSKQNVHMLDMYGFNFPLRNFSVIYFSNLSHIFVKNIIVAALVDSLLTSNSSQTGTI